MQHKSAAEIADALGGKRSGSGWMAFCPAHDDQNTPNLSINEGNSGKPLVKCFAGCDQDAVISALKDRGLWGEGGVSPSKSLQPCNRATGVNLEEYAKAKKLDIEFLKSLDLSDFTYLGKPAIRIPYLNAEGNELSVRIRRELSKRNPDQRFRWKKGTKPRLYGLWRLNQSAESVYLVEGESDCHTLWSHGFNAIGVPGATNWKEGRDAQHLIHFERINVVIEPDAGGSAVLKWIESSEIRDRVYLVRIETGDISAMHCEGPAQFTDRLNQAVEQAESWTEYHAKLKENARQEAWGTCRALAESPDILEIFERDLSKMGVVGASRIGKILYLALVSRFLPRPVSVAVKGTSSGGKSYIIEQTLKFFPQEAYYALSAMSEKALVYSEEHLKHRFLVVYEAAGMEGDMASYFIRSLLSEGRLSYETVERTEGGFKPRRLEREGPTGLLVTTTKLSLHPENETRILSLTIKDTPDQTKLIMRELARGAPESASMERWHALQVWLSNSEHRVVIPYAAKLAEEIDPVAVRLRRDFTQILHLIKAHAILHQASRTRDDQGRIVASLDDYAVVRELVADLISEGIGISVPDSVRETVEAIRKLKGNGSVTTSQIAAELLLDKSATSRRVKVAKDRGFVQNLETKRGKPAKLILGDPLPEETDILPTVEVLQCCSENEGVLPPLPPMHCTNLGSPNRTIGVNEMLI